MKKKVLVLIVGLVAIGFNGFAADGDLIVSGKLGVGTAEAPNQRITVYDPYTTSYIAINSPGSGLILGSNGTIASKRADGDLYVNHDGMGDGTANTYFMDGGTTTLLMTLTQGGNLGIGAFGTGTYPLSVNRNGVPFVGNYYQVAEFRDVTPNKGIGMGYDSSSQTGIIAGSSNGPSSNIAFWNWDQTNGWGERMRITNSGNIGIGTASPGNILTVMQSSTYDPIADSWGTYQCDRTTKEIIRTLPPQSGTLDRLLEVELYEWKRKPLVSDYEIQNQFWTDGRSADLEKRRQELADLKSKLPKFQATRLGIMLDDPNIPEEIVAIDGAGNKGLDLVGYIGWLHATIKELAIRVRELEKR
jgi:hypothetical protein